MILPPSHAWLLLVARPRAGWRFVASYPCFCSASTGAENFLAGVLDGELAPGKVEGLALCVRARGSLSSVQVEAIPGLYVAQ